MTVTNLTTKKIPLPEPAMQANSDAKLTGSGIPNIPPEVLIERGMAFVHKYRRAFERLS